MPILRVGKKEYNVTLLDKKMNQIFLKLSSERKILDDILINISKTIDPKSDENTMRAIIYKYLKNTKIKFKDIKIREI